MKSFNSREYWGEFALNWFFYLTLILIMLNAVNGIIVDTFQQLREDKIKRDFQRANVCFVCTLNRHYFEFRGEDYQRHIEKHHNISSYLFYLIKIKSTNKYDLNAADTHVLQCFEEKKTDFFPIKQCLPTIMKENS
jgi:inositol 1,4,5-triphosphate receptor type 3